MKRLLAVLVVLVCVGATLSALDLSAGLGGDFNAAFSTYVTDPSDLAKDLHQHAVGGGFFAFFDATYAEADVGLLINSNNTDTGEAKEAILLTSLRLSLYGKYPIPLGGLTLFPMLGIDGTIGLGGSVDGEAIEKFSDLNEDGDFNTLFFRLGIGADINLTEKLYLRPAFLYGIRLNHKYESDAISDNDAIKAIIGHGLDVRVALGFKF